MKRLHAHSICNIFVRQELAFIQLRHHQFDVKGMGWYYLYEFFDLQALGEIAIAIWFIKMMQHAETPIDAAAAP